MAWARLCWVIRSISVAPEEALTTAGVTAAERARGRITPCSRRLRLSAAGCPGFGDPAPGLTAEQTPARRVFQPIE
jgi:hypothetical protein